LAAGVKDFSQAKLEYGDWLDQLLSHPVKGLENTESFLKN
jgi:hypothetical protein